MKITISILVLALIITNVFWFYQVIDAKVTLSYRDQHIEALEETREQLMSILPDVTKNTTKEEIIKAASKYTKQQVFEKDGCTWVGKLGLKFDENNKLQSVSPLWSFGEKDPCYPT
ncbi:hypothetical protein [Kangiella aquimarina]|uniref:Uncharacterized protein n=1 Tax=Kangiella aquimarina TaxID=261965 RepID=A0ABZ0X3F5_9GAMM|nr:hypothetical protein [Kangiella aquimarina]WQG85131.1 hypothetical protein SR900_11735 [Kangiella aquimarina]